MTTKETLERVLLKLDEIDRRLKVLEERQQVVIMTPVYIPAPVDPTPAPYPYPSIGPVWSTI